MSGFHGDLCCGRHPALSPCGVILEWKNAVKQLLLIVRKKKKLILLDLFLEGSWKGKRAQPLLPKCLPLFLNDSCKFACGPPLSAYSGDGRVIPNTLMRQSPLGSQPVHT